MVFIYKSFVFDTILKWLNFIVGFVFLFLYCFRERDALISYGKNKEEKNMIFNFKFNLSYLNIYF